MKEREGEKEVVEKEGRGERETEIKRRNGDRLLRTMSQFRTLLLGVLLCFGSLSRFTCTSPVKGTVYIICMCPYINSLDDNSQTA